MTPVSLAPGSPSLPCPTLIVWGTQDMFFDLSCAYWLKSLIPGASEVIEIDGGRLFFPEERPADLIDALRKHWAR
jgi:pimeloyl-ACP methyl ester carboxylesterase